MGLTQNKEKKWKRPKMTRNNYNFTKIMTTQILIQFIYLFLNKTLRLSFCSALSSNLVKACCPNPAFIALRHNTTTLKTTKGYSKVNLRFHKMSSLRRDPREKKEGQGEDQESAEIGDSSDVEEGPGKGVREFFFFQTFRERTVNVIHSHFRNNMKRN